MRRRLECALAVVIVAVAGFGVFGPSGPASGQGLPPGFTIPSIPPRPSFTTPSFTIPPPPTMPPFTTPSTTPPPTMPPPTTTPPPTMPPPTRPSPPTIPQPPSVTLPPRVEAAIGEIIDQLEQFGDEFQELVEELQALLDRF